MVKKQKNIKLNKFKLICIRVYPGGTQVSDKLKNKIN